MNLYVVNLKSEDDAVEEWLSKALPFLMPSRIEAIHRHRYEMDKARSIAAGLLLNYALREHLAQSLNPRGREIQKKEWKGLADLLQDISKLLGSSTPNRIGKDEVVVPNRIGKDEVDAHNRIGKDEVIAPNRIWKDEVIAPNSIGEVEDGASASRNFMWINGTKVFTAQGAHGKPYLPQYPEFHYNISHSGEYVVLCAQQSLCGIDVQEERKLSEHFLERFFSKEEREWLSEHPREAIRIFSLKEALCKATGQGIGKDFAKTSVLPLLTESGLCHEGRQWNAYCDIYPGKQSNYALAVVYEASEE